jgi:diguanylate cyclase (GGDEF)-like protein
VAIIVVLSLYPDRQTVSASLRNLVARLEPGAHRNDALFIVIGLITSVFSFSYILVSLLIGFMPGAILQSVCFVLLLGTLFFFSRSGRYRLCTHLFLGICFFVSILGCSLLSGGIHSMVTPWFVLVPLISVLLHTTLLDTLVWGALAAFTVIAYGAMAMSGHALPILYNSSMQAFFHTLCISGLLLCLCWLAFIFGQNRQRTMATISAQKEDLERALAEIEQLAFYDVLTQLPNRRLFMDRLEQARAESRRNGRYAALLFIDMDNFKSLNDRHGHNAGDALLCQVALRLQDSLRQTDTIARFGGDEFAILLGSLDEDPACARHNTQAVADKIVESLACPYLLEISTGEHPASLIEHQSTASIGVVLFLGQTEDVRALLIAADKAMYAVKAAGGNAAMIFNHQAASGATPAAGPAQVTRG